MIERGDAEFQPGWLAPNVTNQIAAAVTSWEWTA